MSTQITSAGNQPLKNAGEGQMDLDTPRVQAPSRRKLKTATNQSPKMSATGAGSGGQMDFTRTREDRLAAKRRLREEALAAYRDTTAPLKLIAERFGRSPATIVNWAKAAGLPGRHRGRPRRTEPTDEQKGVLRKIGTAPLRVLGKQVGWSKQAVHALARRYPEWVPQRPIKQSL